MMLVVKSVTIFLIFAVSRIKPISSLNSVAIIGSGSWGSAIARRVALNLQQSKLKPLYHDEVKMWVYKAEVNGKKLTEIINEDHTNQKYLPGIPLPTNVVACNDLIETCSQAEILMFVLPHQYLGGVLNQLKGKVRKDATAVSLIKGIHLTKEGPQLISEKIKNELELIKTSVVMGANVASDVAKDKFVETTVASTSLEVREEVSNLLNCENFRTQLSGDVSSVELLGALKNVVAVAAGFCDGLDTGPSTKAAVLRQGLQEMQEFCRTFDMTESFQIETILTSGGVADLFASSIGGRNRKCSEIFAHRLKQEKIQKPSKNIKINDLSTDGLDWLDQLWVEIERETLNGQKLQGVSTCKELLTCLQFTGLLEEKPFRFPLFRRVYGIAWQGMSLETLFSWDF